MMAIRDRVFERYYKLEARNAGIQPASFLVYAVFASMVGCAAPSVDLIPPSQTNPGRAWSTYDDRPWATVVRENVKEGLVDYTHLSKHRDALGAYFNMIARFGPEQTPQYFPSHEARACYYINAYNAVVLGVVLHLEIPESVHTLQFGSIDHRFRFRVDGRNRKLAELRESAIAESGSDMRVVLALCNAAMSGPRLHDQPFRPDGLEDTLRQLAQRTMDDPNMVSIDHERQLLLVSPLIATHADEFIAAYERKTGARDATLLNVVLSLANPVRRQWLNTAVGYDMSVLPFDRRLNRYPPPQK